MLYVSASEVVTPLNVHNVFPTFLILGSNAPPSLLSFDPSSSLTSPTYVSNQWIPIKAARENFNLTVDEKVIEELQRSKIIPRDVMLENLHGLNAEKAFDTYAATWAKFDPATTHETQNTVDAVRQAQSIGPDPTSRSQRDHWRSLMYSI